MGKNSCNIFWFPLTSPIGGNHSWSMWDTCRKPKKVIVILDCNTTSVLYYGLLDKEKTKTWKEWPRIEWRRGNSSMKKM